MNAAASDLDGEDDVAAAPSGAVGSEHYSLIVDEAAAGRRLDAHLAAALKTVSRSRIRRAIDEGLANVNGVQQKASYRVAAGERVEVQVPAAIEMPQPEPTPLDV